MSISVGVKCGTFAVVFSYDISLVVPETEFTAYGSLSISGVVYGFQFSGQRGVGVFLTSLRGVRDVQDGHVEAEGSVLWFCGQALVGNSGNVEVGSGGMEVAKLSQEYPLLDNAAIFVK